MRNLLIILISLLSFNSYSNDTIGNEDPTTIDTLSTKYKNPLKVKNFVGNVSGSFGIKLVDLNLSRLRFEYEHCTTSRLVTFGGTLHLYMIRDYYNGYKVETFLRIYHPEDGNGYGAFIQGRIGFGQLSYKNETFNTYGAGFDLGFKFLLGNDHNDYKNWITITPIAGIQIYNAPDGTLPISNIFQIRFGYQF